MTCPQCQTPMTEGYLYVRGIGSSLSWSMRGDIRPFSRQDLDQLDLSSMSRTPTGAQAVISAPRCGSCGLIAMQQDPGHG